MRYSFRFVGFGEATSCLAPSGQNFWDNVEAAEI